MEFWNTAKDVFDSLIQNVCSKAAEEAQENNILKVLQPELLVHIVKFLPESDLFTVRLVCKKFNEAATCPQVFQLDLKKLDLELKELQVEVLQPLFKNIISIKICNMEEKDAEELAKFFEKLEEQCMNLKVLTISSGCIPANITLENIVERLSELVMINVEFKNASYFFGTSSENLVYRNLEILEMYNCTGIGEEETPFETFSMAPMRRLRKLILDDVQVIGDQDYLHLKDSTANLNDLLLVENNINLETFQQLDLRKLKSLDVNLSRTNDDWLSPIKKLLELETLTISNINIIDTCSIATFKKLNNIKSLTITDCNFGNLTVSAIVSQLPNLVSLEIMPSEDGNVTDTALNNFVVHNNLESVKFDRVQFRGFALRQLAQFAPALKELKLTICAAEDDDMDVFKDHFNLLKKLDITGLRITDVGIAKLDSKLNLMEEIHIESRFVTPTGIISILPFLNSVKRLDIEFGDPQSSIKISEWKNNYDILSFGGPGITKEVLLSFTKTFNDVKFALRFDNVTTLGVAELRHFIETQPRVNTLIINTCIVDEEMAALLLKDFPDLIILILYGCQLTREALLKLFQGLESKKIDLITIESEILLQEDTFLEVLPMLKNVSNIIVHNSDYEQLININNNLTDTKEVSFQGLEHLTNEMLEKIMSSYYEISNLTISDTGVTVEGIEEIAVHLTKLTYLKIKSKILGDETMEVIGRHFPNLKTLTVNGEFFTDVGLLTLDKHLEKLESLTVVNSAITDEGIKKIAPLLKSATHLDLYSGNLKVTAELLAYMRETYPNITHEEPEMEEESEEGQEANNGEAAEEPPVQPEEVPADQINQEGGENAVELIQPEVQNLVVDVPVQPEDLNEVAAHEDQFEGENRFDTEPPEKNEVEMERQTPKEQNRVIEEQGQSERKNLENLDQRPTEEENGIYI